MTTESQTKTQYVCGYREIYLNLYVFAFVTDFNLFKKNGEIDRL